jgi:hypothetical protein
MTDPLLPPITTPAHIGDLVLIPTAAYEHVLQLLHDLATIDLQNSERRIRLYSALHQLGQASPLGHTNLLAAYERLHDGLSEMIESGLISQDAINPGVYFWLVESLAALANPGDAQR